MALIGKAAGKRGASDGDATGQQRPSAGELESNVVGMRRKAELAVKGADQMEFGEAAQAHQRIDRDRLLDMGAEIVAHWSERRGTPEANGRHRSRCVDSNALSQTGQINSTAHKVVMTRSGSSFCY